MKEATKAKNGKKSIKIVKMVQKQASINENTLPIGQVVSYGDMANQRQKAVVVVEKSSKNGQRCVFVDDLHESGVSRQNIEGPGGWRLENDPAWNKEAIDQLLEMRVAKKASIKNAFDKEKQDRIDQIAKGREILAAKMPAWAKGAIVAYHKVNDCDTQSDYFNVKNTREVIIGWSPNIWNMFPEMRKAAKACGMEELRHLWDEPSKEDEHRENYTGGYGYYLQRGGSYDTGWAIKKVTSLNSDALAMMAGSENGYMVQDTPEKTTQKTLAATSAR